MIRARHAARVGDDDQVGASSPLAGFEKDDIAYGRDLPGDRIAQGGLRDRFAGPELDLDRVPETADDRHHLIRIVVDVANAGVLGPGDGVSDANAACGASVTAAAPRTENATRRCHTAPTPRQKRFLAPSSVSTNSVAGGDRRRPAFCGARA